MPATQKLQIEHCSEPSPLGSRGEERAGNRVILPRAPRLLLGYPSYQVETVQIV